MAFCGAGTGGQIDAVRSWVASGADIDIEAESAVTPLMMASRWLRTECVAEMLRLGADARRATNNGWTALHRVAAYATDGDVGGVVRLLVVAGCDAAARDYRGRTAVDLAREDRGAEWASEVEGWVAAAVRMKPVGTSPSDGCPHKDGPNLSANLRGRRGCVVA